MQDVFCNAACSNAKHSQACYGVQIDNQITVPILLTVCWGSYFLPFSFFVDNCLLKQHPVQTLFSSPSPQKTINYKQHTATFATFTTVQIHLFKLEKVSMIFLACFF